MPKSSFSSPSAGWSAPKASQSRADTWASTSTQRASSSYNIIYDRRYGGYGYYDNGIWMDYDVFTDTVTLGSLMNNHSYYYPRTTVVYSSPTYDSDQTVVYTNNSSSAIGLIVFFSIIFLIGIVALSVASRN